MFHPKVYFFDLGERAEVFLGSANLTNGGLFKNIECGVFLNGEVDSESLQDFYRHIEALWKKAEKLDPDFIT
jgi:HKD family nuclease